MPTPTGTNRFPPVTSAQSQSTESAGFPVPFPTALCGLDGTRLAVEAAVQAGLLTGPEGRLTLFSVAFETGAGLTQKALLGVERARQALVDMQRELEHVGGLRVLTQVTESPAVADVLLEEAAEHDLVAVGGWRGSRAAGIVLGEVASVLAHRSPVPVLLARATEDAPFPKQILVATDGSEDADRAVRLAVPIAALHDADATVLHVQTDDGPERRRVSEQIDEAFSGSGLEPAVAIEDGAPVEVIVETAARTGASLLITGSRGLGGVKALGSVSERVAHAAPCSVLIARPPQGGRGEGG